MNHAFRPTAEQLEAHVLLSSVAPVPGTAFPGSPIVETLTTDKSVYKVGQPIHITLTETNTTNVDFLSPNVKGLDSFTASQHYMDLWKSNGSRRAAPSFTLAPGQTHTITVTWNGHANVGSKSRSKPLTGTFQIDNTLANNSVSIAIDPRHGKGANAGVTASVPDEPLTLTD
jgi:hypothetical protein